MNRTQLIHHHMPQQQDPDDSRRRRALVISNTDYSSLNNYLSDLAKVKEQSCSSDDENIVVFNDDDVEDAATFPEAHQKDVNILNNLLRDKLHFQSLFNSNVDKRQMKQMVRDFALSTQTLCEMSSRSIDSEDPGVEFLLVYFSGYTLQIEGQNYLVPCMQITDDNKEDYVFTTKSDIEDACLSMNWVIKHISERCHAVHTKIFIFNSHVNNPFERFYLSSCMTDNRNTQLIIMKDGLTDTYLPSKSIIALAGPPRIPENFSPPLYSTGLLFTNKLIQELKRISESASINVEQSFRAIETYVNEQSLGDVEVQIATSFVKPVNMAINVTKEEQTFIAIPEDFDTPGIKKKSWTRKLLGKTSKHEVAKITRSSKILVMEEDKLRKYITDNKRKEDVPQAYSSLSEALDAAHELKEKEMVTIEIDEGNYFENRVIVLDRANTIIQGMPDKQKNHILLRMKKLKIMKANIVITGVTFGPSFDEQGYIDDAKQSAAKLGKSSLKKYDYDTDESTPSFSIEVQGVNPVKIQNCVVFGSIKVTGSDATQTEINACTITRAYNRAAISVKGAHPQVTNCSIHDNESIGIKISDKGAGKYEGNGIYNHSRPAVVVRQRAKPIFRNNNIYDNFANGIVVEEGGSGIFHSNDLHHNKYPAVYIASCPHKSIEMQANSSSRSLKSMDTHQQQQFSAPQFIKNRIHDNESNGVIFTHRCVVEFVGNEVYHHHTDAAILVEKGGEPRIHSNKIYDNKSHGLVVTESKGTYSSNEIYNHQAAAVLVSSCTDYVFKNNQFYNNESNGVMLCAESRGHYENNTFRNHSQAAINITNLSYPEFKKNTIVSKGGAIRISEKSGGSFIENDISEGDKPLIIIGSSCKSILFQGNSFHDAYSNGIIILKSTSDVTISSNRMVNINKPVIVARANCGPNIKIHKNTMMDNYKCAIYVEKDAKDVIITNNTFKDHHSSPAVILEEGSEVHLEETANTFIDNEENVLVVSLTIEE